MQREHPPEHWLNVNGLNLSYLDWTGPGIPIVSLHGLASSGHWWDLVAPRLVESHQIVALDQRAHGRSDQPYTGYDWSTLASDVTGSMDRLGIDRAVLMGHSWGASVATSVATLHPERVAALILVDGGFAWGGRSPGIPWEEFKQRLQPRDIYGPVERYLGALKGQFEHCWSDNLEHIVMTMVRREEDGTVWERLEPENHEQVLWAMWSDPPAARLPEVRCPTLLAAAGGRKSDPNEGYLRRRKEGIEAALSALPNGRVLWVAESGHDIGYEQPGELASGIRDFLARERLSP